MPNITQYVYLFIPRLHGHEYVQIFSWSKFNGAEDTSDDGEINLAI
jgi:hypothetical protein